MAKPYKGTLKKKPVGHTCVHIANFSASRPPPHVLNRFLKIAKPENRSTTQRSVVIYCDDVIVINIQNSSIIIGIYRLLNDQSLIFRV